MSLLSFLRGRTTPKPDQRHEDNSRVASISRATQSESRREMIRLALRDMMTRQGIPASWLDVEVLWLAKSKAASAPTMHVRLLIKHPEPQLLSHGLSFQRSLLKRVSLFDPKASAWLGGVSWQFAVPESVPSPELRGPGLRSVAPASPAVPAAPPTPAARVPNQPSVQAQVDELRRLFAIGDAERAAADATSAEPPGFEDTRPFGLR